MSSQNDWCTYTGSKNPSSISTSKTILIDVAPFTSTYRLKHQYPLENTCLVPWRFIIISIYGLRGK
jgi:hypothetical protein